MKRAEVLFLRWVWQHISTLPHQCCVAECATTHVFNDVSSGFGIEQNKAFFATKKLFLPQRCLGSCALHGLDNATLVTDCYHSYPSSVSAGPSQVPHPAGESDRWGSTAPLVSLLHTHPGVCNKEANESGKWKIACRGVTLHTWFSSLLTLSLSLCAGWAGYYIWCCSTTYVCGGWKKSDCWGNYLVLDENVLSYAKGSGIPRIRSGTNSSGKNNAISFN